MGDTKEQRYFKGSTDGKAPSRTDPLKGAKERYDLIVIGSGLGGLTAANLLARAGHSVAILEQHYNFGGLATWFKRRGGHVFDVSLHGFPVGMKKTCRKYWNAEIADSIQRLDGIRFENPQFTLDTEFTRADFTDKLVTVFGLERARVEAFYAELAGMNFYDDAGETVGQLFERHFPGRNDVHRLLLEPISYANGSTMEDPAIAYGIVFSNFMSQGVYTFQGGTDKLVRAMKAELEKNGVDLFNKVQVERVVVEGGAVRGVLAEGRFLGAHAVISNANLKSTVERLVGAEHVSPAFLAGVRGVRLNNSSTQVYLGIREGEELPWVTDLLFTSTRATFDSPALCDLHGESRTFSFYYPKTRPGSNRATIVSSTNARWSDWAHLDDAAYEREKARLVADTLDALDRHVPGVRAKIDHVEAATPRTFAFYTQHPEGTSFGTKFEGLQYSFDLPKEVRGLYHAGSVGIIMSGWLGAANYGVITANKADAFLRAELPEAPAKDVLVPRPAPLPAPLPQDTATTRQGTTA
ncbi:MAG: NAD(P)/FAD-dependent oxidoreductase [Planctomycetes bacterium]|nr:NAD(P)/FAD-dependent oxidoreductase [Planctomycetota bacterium]